MTAPALSGNIAVSEIITLPQITNSLYAGGQFDEIIQPIDFLAAERKKRVESLPEFLKQRAARSFRRLIEQTQGLTSEQALRYGNDAWPDHAWGLGQNGSIAGIVYHVVAWKQVTLAAFAPGGTIVGRDAFDTAAAPESHDWPSILAWLERVGVDWQAQLQNVPDARFEETLVWEGETITLAKLVTEMLEHDIQHASQIEYLRQRLKVE